VLRGAGGNSSAAAHALAGGLPAAKGVSFWLYNMLARPLSADQLLLAGSEPTQLANVTNSSAYSLGFGLPAGMRTSQVRQRRTRHP
jgi:hypothetical protein